MSMLKKHVIEVMTIKVLAGSLHNIVMTMSVCTHVHRDPLFESGSKIGS